MKPSERQMLIGPTSTRVFAGVRGVVQSFHCRTLTSPASHGALRFILSLRATGEGHISPSPSARHRERAASDPPTPPVPFVTEPSACPTCLRQAALCPKLEERAQKIFAGASGPASRGFHAERAKVCWRRATAAPPTPRRPSGAATVAGRIKLRGASPRQPVSQRPLPPRPVRATASKTRFVRFQKTTAVYLLRDLHRV
jgi:hypothetical protein